MTEIKEGVPGTAGKELTRLTIAEIETIPVRVPAGADLQGQPLQDDPPVDHRHPHPHRGGDRRGGVLRRRGRGASRDRRDHQARDRPARDRRGRVPTRAHLGARAPGDLRHPARPQAGPRCDRVRRRGPLGRTRQGARPAALPPLGRVPRQRPGDHDRRLLRTPRHRGGGREPARARPCRDEVQGRRAHPGGGCRALPRRADDRRPGFRPLRRRQPGLDARRGDHASPAASPTSTSTGSRSPASGRTTVAPCGTSASQAASECAPVRASSPRAAAAT